MAVKKDNQDDNSVLAREEDGTIQITFTIPFSQIKVERQHALSELSQTVEVPGFRKGKAPLDQVMTRVSQNKLLEKTLSHILPGLLNKAIQKHKIMPIIYPKFELVKADEEKDWEVRAITCEAPVVNLGDYKKVIRSNNKSSAIWTPDSQSQSKSKDHQPTMEEKEQKALKTLLDNVKVKIPRVLIQEEVDGRLSSLLSRIEKLGLTLESYLSSTGKTAEELRKDYEKVSSEGLAVDFILTKIAEDENIKVDDKDVEKALAATPKNESDQIGNDADRKRLVESILRRRKALDFIISLV